MPQKRQLFKAIQKNFRQISKQFLSAINKQIIWLLRAFFGNRRRHSSANAGFVLPTVAMVTLVVVLLTTAILFRSFERSKNASNVRVNEAVLNAATPALDRARAKLDALLEDPTLPRGTPSDSALYDAFKKDKYRLGDETRLKLAFELPLNPDGTANTADIQNPTSTTSIEYDETLKSAWKFAVDTDNNGKKDTFTLYGIFFRSPSRDSITGLFNRERKPLDARTPPMDSSSNQQCGGASGFASLVGNSSWYKLNSGNLGKSFFVYTVNVPITQLGSLNDTEYETFKGNKSVVALEFQQDRTRVPLANNAVFFENDLEVIVGSTTLLLNGRVHTNGNLLVGAIDSGGNITLRQVSSKTSCFYNEENGQISVGGNVGNGSLSQSNISTGVTVDLYRGFGNGISTASINNTNKSTGSTGGGSIGFNDAAFNQRINAMKTTAIALCTECNSAANGSALKTAVDDSNYPADVKTNVTAKVQAADDATTAKNILYDEIEIYLRNRTRRVPFAEVSDATGAGATTGYTAISATLEPQATWREPLNSSNQFTGATSISVTTSQLQATQPNLQKKEGIQTDLGDRIFVGNNLPALWLKDGKYVGSDAQQPILNSGSAVNWTRSGSEPPARWRSTQIQAVADLGLSDRNGFWEENATKNPTNVLDNVGGVRIVTGAGIYVDAPGSVGDSVVGPFYPRVNSTLTLASFLPPPSATDTTIVWPDTMPMSTPGNPRKGDLLMRATAVYHYKVDYGTDQEPIACVSSYFDPSDENTVKNRINKDGGYGVDTVAGRSNNGIVYNFPGRSTFTTNQARLLRQSNLKFPNGRLVNKPLKDALTKIGAATTVPSTGLQLADYSAIDTALCAISILTAPNSFVTTPTNQPAHGAIKEATFLDAREVKQISTPASPTTYNLDLEQRQPLEIRVTDIDLGSIAGTVISPASGTSDYLLPYSGIIYASRDDALRDASVSYTETDVSSVSRSELLSPTDFNLDSTRRPNGIRLINGGTLARTSTNTYNAQEKGLILVTNLPAYIKGNFNLHRTDTTSTTEIEEFTEIEPSVNFYDRSTRENRFACRPGRAGCPVAATGGDFWRPATIIADSMTLLSDSFQEGVRRYGDYDLNNNTGIPVEDNFDLDIPNSNFAFTLPAGLNDIRKNRLKNGFWENSFLTSAWWAENNGSPRTTAGLGSYTFNGVTPIQRRVNFPEYLMEVCTSPFVEQCGPNDWYVNPATSRKASSTVGETLNISTHRAGTTNLLSDSTYRRYPRRIALKRNTSNELEKQGNKYIFLGIHTDGTIKEFPYAGSTLPRPVDNTLWFRTSASAAPANAQGMAYANDKRLFYYPPIDANGDSIPDPDGQPILVPVLQIHDATSTPSSIRTDGTAQDGFRDNWIQRAANTIFNATFVLGNSPGRPEESSSGLQNFVRLLENWNGRTAKISGSFIQLKRSNYSTAPLASILTAKTTTTATSANDTAGNPALNMGDNLSLFDYPLDTYPTPNLLGLLPFYSPPNRKWGFDVGLLSEQPDLFAQRFTAPPTGRPNEFFREVGRDDNWVKTLLCAGEASNQTGIPASGATINYANAVPNEYRPSGCPSIPSE